MAVDLSQRPIVIKRIKKVARGHHGGTWKIAYADFVTAMMAFFLLMWLLSATSADQKKGISEYFSTPMKIAFFGGEGWVIDQVLLKVGVLTYQLAMVKLILRLKRKIKQ